MATPNQKAEERPISFVLHNMVSGDPVEVRLVIRPEDLTRTDASRLTTTQTLGGAWADNFGKGVPTVQIAGHTGWGAGDRPDGLAEFQRLYETIFVAWHRERDALLKRGLDPAMVKLIFADKLDDFTWVVAPQNFVLKRNRSRPLLSQYQINLTWLSDDVSDVMSALSASGAAGLLDELEKGGLESLLSSIEKIGAFIESEVTSVLGPIRAAFDKVVALTAKVLQAVTRVVNTVKGVIGAVTNGLLGIATSLTRAAANVTNMVMSVMSLPQQIKAQFQRVASAFNNAFCVLRNVFRRRAFLSNYDDLYGASNCSSTAGGRPISRYATANPFPVYFPDKTSGVSVTSSAQASLVKLNNADPVLQPLTVRQLGSELSAVATGVAVA